MGSIAVGERNKMLDAWGANTTYTATSAVWLKLHIGAPGTAGTTNPAATTTRKEATFAAAASGALTNSALISWPTVANTETITHVSCWTASSGGTFLGSDDLPSALEVDAGSTIEIAAGALDITVT